MRIKIKTAHRRTRDVDRSPSSWPVAYRWAAMGTLVAYSAVGSKTFNVARAQDVQRPGPANGSISQTQGSQPVRRFDIPAGPLDSVLAAFEQVTGFSVSVSKEGIRSLSSPAFPACTPPSRRFKSCWPIRA